MAKKKEEQVQEQEVQEHNTNEEVTTVFIRKVPVIICNNGE